MRYSLKLTLNSREPTGEARASHEINCDFLGTSGRAVLRVGLSVWLFGCVYAPFACLFDPRPLVDGVSYLLVYLLIGLFVLYFFCWHYADREIVTITDGMLILRREFWRFGRSICYDVLMLANPQYVPLGDASRGKLRFKYRGKPVETAPGLDQADAQRVLDEIVASQKRTAP